MIEIFQIRLWWAFFSSQSGINTAYYNQKVDKTDSFACHSSADEWGECLNSEYGISFEYPKDWHFVELGKTAVKFGPFTKGLSDNYYVEFSITDMDSKDRAFDVFKPNSTEFVRISTDDGESRINGMPTYKEEIDRDYFAYRTDYLNGKYLYMFNTNFKYAEHRSEMNLSTEEFRNIFDHMSQSLKVKKIYPVTIQASSIKTSPYKDAIYPFSFRYPSSWKVLQENSEETPQGGYGPGYSIDIVASKDGNLDPTICGLNITPYVKDSNITLAQWQKNNFQNLLHDPKVPDAQDTYTSLVMLNYFNFKGETAGADIETMYISTPNVVYGIRLQGHEGCIPFQSEIIRSLEFEKN
jgi:hypothetical protein